MLSSTSSSAKKKRNNNEMKRADKRATITILVLGDEGVGKSSLISTFVSRYFSEVVPGVMTRVRLPPDPRTSCITTIVDSQNGDAALMVHAASLSAAVQQQQQQQQQQSSSLVDNNNNNNGLMAALLERAAGGGTAADTMTTTMSEVAGGDELPMVGADTPAASASLSGASSSEAGAGAIEYVDSIVLVYDLDRVETFFRLENHWLPLIERCYNGKVPVIVAENKMDLFRPSSSGSRSSAVAAAAAAGGGGAGGLTDEQALARKRQQIVSLMQRFPFVRQCIKCSAKNLLRVDDVFLKAQQAVLYPFVPPLYDLETGQLTIECKRAFTRIFRMFDRDHDGLLSDAEIDLFQRETYRVAVFDRDLAAWKKVVTRNNPSETNESVLQDGKFTVQGFLTIFDVFISQNRLDVVWQALREYNYDDDLNLHVPDSVTNPYGDSSSSSFSAASSWKLSHGAKKFLTRLFRQFDSDEDGLLSPDDVVSMFSILPPPGLPPWHPMRARELFEGCFSLPKESLSSGSTSGTDSPDFNVDTSLILPAAMSQSLLSTSGVSILSASDSLPSIDVGGMHPLSKSLSYLEWMGHWHAISVISPSVTRAELYRLGHMDVFKKGRQASERRRMRQHASRSKKKKVLVDPNPATERGGVYYETTLKSREIRILVLGSRGCGKTALLNALCGTFDADGHVKAVDTCPTTRPETSAAHVKITRTFSTSSNGNGAAKLETRTTDDEEFVAHLVFTDVPEAAAARQEEHFRELSELFGSAASPKDRVCDLAMLVFDSNNMSSLSAAKELESTLLTKETPRVFVATKSDLTAGASDSPKATILEQAKDHCREADLEPPLVTSAGESGLGAGGEDRSHALDHLARCALFDESGVEHLRSRPHEEQKRREAARRRKMMWLGGIVSVGVVVAVGVGLLWGSSSKKDQKGTFGWLRSFFRGSRPPREVPQSS